ncbi:hypothetical protein BOSEA31B_10970 [Hyphomicrobiales bacterium]|nr:hypothetical protein BOSEA31B_10970 [Hyphomicrobiales bacterium]CAH1700820.1 hypothetical protein BOSEA1005_20519 [Hyphomicrobiales bacterium]CAI0344695.1 hypothetical protein BO1005MUT1_350062 [Hyphomicrobiales bacterium]
MHSRARHSRCRLPETPSRQCIFLQAPALKLRIQAHPVGIGAEDCLHRPKFATMHRAGGLRASNKIRRDLDGLWRSRMPEGARSRYPSISASRSDAAGGPPKPTSGAGNSTARGVAALADTNGIGFTPLLAERTNCRRRDPSGFC